VATILIILNWPNWPISCSLKVCLCFAWRIGGPCASVGYATVHASHVYNFFPEFWRLVTFRAEHWQIGYMRIRKRLRGPTSAVFFCFYGFWINGFWVCSAQGMRRVNRQTDRQTGGRTFICFHFLLEFIVLNILCPKSACPKKVKVGKC